MWRYEHVVDTDATPEAIWGLYSDVAGWGGWDADIESIAIDGPFAAGSLITMTPRGQEPVLLRVAEATENVGFVDEARFDGMVLRTVHRADRRADGGTRVVYRMEITGDAADELGPRIGPAVTGDWPETMAALVEAARR